MTQADEAAAMCVAGELGTWEIRLHDGSIISAVAHAFHRTQNDHVFSILMEGRPHFDVDILRVPSKLIADVMSV